MEASTAPLAPSIATTKPRGLKGLKWKNKYFAYIGGVALTAYGITWLIKQRSMLDKTCFRPTGFAPISLTLSNASINIKLNLKNKSSVGYYLKNQVYNTFINGQFVGVIRNSKSQYILPESPNDVWLNVKFNPMQVTNISWDTLKDLILKNSDVKIQIKGSATVVTKGKIFAFSYPVDETFNLRDIAKGGTSEPC